MSDWTTIEIPDQRGRTALITGANSGIGYEAAEALAVKGAHVVLACRNAQKARDAEIRIERVMPAASVEVLILDLADLESVESAAQNFRADHDRIDLLINNAGLMAIPERRTAQGFEMQIGVNHFGHFAWTARLLDLVTATPGSRVVSISSQGHRPGRIAFDDINSKRGYAAWPAYFQSKLANLLFTRELQRRFDDHGVDTLSVAAHPGASDTNLGSEGPGGLMGVVMKAFMGPLTSVLAQSAAMGALPTLRAATDPGASGGDYYGPDGFGEQRGNPVKVDMSHRAKNDADARRLWELSEELTGVTFEF